MAPALAALNARIFTLALPRIPAMSASVPGRFSQETVSCFTFGMRGSSRQEKWHDATRGVRSGQFPNRRKSRCGRWDSKHACGLKRRKLPVFRLARTVENAQNAAVTHTEHTRARGLRSCPTRYA